MGVNLMKPSQRLCPNSGKAFLQLFTGIVGHDANMQANGLGG